MSTFFTTTTTTSLFLRRTMNERREIEWWPHFKLHRALLFPLLPLSSDILFLQHDNSTLRQCMRFSEEASQFSVGQIAQSLTCSIMEKSHTGLDECLSVLRLCFRKRMSASHSLSAQICLNRALSPIQELSNSAEGQKEQKDETPKEGSIIRRGREGRRRNLTPIVVARYFRPIRESQ